MRLIDADEAYDVLSEYYHHKTYIQHLGLEEALYRVSTVDAVPWEFLERYAEWFCAMVSFPEFIREAKQFYIDAERYERWCNE